MKRCAFSTSAFWVEPGLYSLRQHEREGVEPGLYSLCQHEREGVEPGLYSPRQHERFVGRPWFILAASRAQRCMQQTERNGGFGFQTKMKDRFLNQRS